jgi:hypothetical protein
MATRATIDHPDSTGRDGAIDHMAKWLEGAPAGTTGRRLCDSDDGHVWYLVNDRTGPSVVRVPDESPSGPIDRFTIGAFLAQGDGPEQQALLDLIGTLVDHD